MTLTRTTPTTEDKVRQDLEAWDDELESDPADAAESLGLDDDADLDDHVSSPISGPTLHVAGSAIHGTGVFADRAFVPDDLIERCPVLVVPPEQALPIGESTLGDYVYEWLDGYAVALGFGSLYNHSRSSNARYEMDFDAEEIHVVAVRAIRRGDEVTVNYNGDPSDSSPVWFEQD